MTVPGPARRFANLADAGAALAAHLLAAHPGQSAPRPGCTVVAVLPNGVPVALPIAAALGAPVVAARIDRTGEPSAVIEGSLRGVTAMVIDDGVETGTAAHLVAAAAREAGAERLVLAVPVCPREASASLRLVYDEIEALAQPLGRRNLRWHFDEFDTIDEARARALLAAHERV